ncbi:response regulator transcription factor [Virgibacillus ndiopensis]|uniref:response regulator transcription factor n=1 Tax=Virgibacillus ndiopensis TaxID=2004408 RepID=UPI000C073345|nr:response regulator transcription factor [Virgibacillus ndiopensis]
MTVKAKVILAEDDEGIRGLIQLYLENRNYAVFPAENGEQALELVQTENPQIVLLDIEMPGMNGFDVCQQIREKMDIPIIFISSRKDVMDKIKCFELGGDDYITKPFDFAEMEARVRAFLRRYHNGHKQTDSSILQYGDLSINLDAFKCFLKGKEINLSAIEMRMLIMLAKKPNQVFSAEQIYNQIWGLDSMGDVQTVKVHIRNLRSKLEEIPTKPLFIQTVRGFGYRFNID